MIKLGDLRSPLALWDALDGEPAAFVAKLRSDEPLSRPERACLAYWLENGFQPPKRKRGRPTDNTLGGFRSDRLGLAVGRYQILWRLIRQTGRHLKKAGSRRWSPERLRQAIAKRYNVDDEQLNRELRRGGKPKIQRVSFGDHWVEYLENRRNK